MSIKEDKDRDRGIKLTIDGVPQDEWIEQNADPIWLHQNEMWEVLHARETQKPNEDEDVF